MVILVMPEAVLIFDADVLITLAQHPENLAAITAIQKAIETKDPWRELVVPQSVKEAYEREKEEAAHAYWATHRAAIRALRVLGDAVSDRERTKAIADEFNDKVDKLERSVPSTVAAVDALISAGRLVPTTNDMWAEAAQRFRQDKPPAGRRQQKSSITDCVLWQVVVAESRTSPVTFCSNNKRDFSDPMHDEKLHPALVEELGSAKYCYHLLRGFQQHHLKQVEVVVGPVFDPAIKCFYCGADTETGLIPKPSMYGGWTYQKFCRICGKFSDTGEPYDE
jgi:hypothetical protein